MKKVLDRRDLLELKEDEVVNISDRVELAIYFAVSDDLTDIRTARREGKYIVESFYCNPPDDAEISHPFFVMKGLRNTYYNLENGSRILIFDFDGLDGKLEKHKM